MKTPVSRTPISYYGGKLNLVRHILPLIPSHDYYVEPFAGGAAVFWAKQPCKTEVINDLNHLVSNFWEVCKYDFEKLNHLIQNTFHSEYDHRKAREIILKPIEDKIVWAWAFWVQTNMSFSNGLLKGFAYSQRGQASRTHNKKLSFTESISERLKNTEIFNRDAIGLILKKDSPDTFFYLDPPYAESNCGHYEKGKDVYYQLLEILPQLKGKFLMSSYPSAQLDELRKTHGFYSHDIVQVKAVSGKHISRDRTKTECLTANYNIHELA